MHRLIASILGIFVLNSITETTAMASFPAQTVRRDSIDHVHGASFGSDSATHVAGDSAHGTGRTFTRNSAGRSMSDSVLGMKPVPDSSSRTRVDTAIRILPLHSVGSLTPLSLPYPGLDADGIRWNEYRTPTDLLSAFPGVFVRDMGSPGQDNQVTINGAEHNGTAVLVDGIIQNDPVTGTYNFAFFPVEAIERLEIVTGPRSFLYGDNAVGGTVNVVTKNYSNNKPYTHIRYSQGVNSYSQTDAMFSQNVLPRFNLSFGLSYLGYGSALNGDQNRGRFPNSDNEAYTFRTKLRYNVSQTVNLVFTHFYYSTQTGLNGGINVSQTLLSGANVYDENAATVVNLESYEKRFNHHAALTGIYRPLHDSALSASLSFYGMQQLREYRDEENRGFPTNGINIHDDFGSTVLGVRGQMDYQLSGNLFTAIGEIKNTRYDQSIYNPATTQGRRTLSLKDEFSIAQYVTFAVYSKVENAEHRQAIDNTGADATFHLPGILELRAGASVALRHIPNAELYLLQGNADSTIQKMLGSSFLPPHSITGYFPIDERHAVAEASLTFTPSRNVSIGITATRGTIEDWVDRTYIKALQRQDLTLDLVSATFHGRSGNFYLDAEGTFTDQTEVFRLGAPIRLYPEWRGRGSLYFRGLLANGNLDLKAGVRGSFYSAFDGEQFKMVDGVPNPIVDRPIGNAGTVDLVVVAHIGDAYIHVLWENLTNSAFMLTPFYPMYDRSIRFGVSWEFLD